MLLDLFYDRQILLNCLLILSKRGDAVSYLVDDVTQHDHSKDLDEDNNKDLLRIFGCNVSVSDGHDGGCAEVEGVEIEDVLVVFVDVERSHPVVVGVEFCG